MFRPSNSNQMTTACQLLTPQETKTLGVVEKTFVEADIFNCNFKSYGGTEVVTNDILTIEDTAQITCWYNPNIKGNCRIKRLVDGAIFEILGEPENVEMRNMVMIFKVKRVRGGA